jgi:Fungal Zn(2)-Cys(6) binuclear cluster domain
VAQLRATLSTRPNTMMSTFPPTSGTPAPASASTSAFASESRQPAKSKPRRLLACVLCQQRKVKCDHNYPCATCVKARVQCVQATPAPRRRRRQFPERALLVHLRQCEDLLSQHNIKFEPLRPNPQSTEDNNSPASAWKASYDSDDEELGNNTTAANGDVPPGTITPIPDRTKVYVAKYALSKNCSHVPSCAN